MSGSFGKGLVAAAVLNRQNSVFRGAENID